MSEPAYTRLGVDERRRRLLMLGADLFARHPYDELSMARIAREAGISKALLYHYFPSKQAYFAATLEQAAAELAQATAPDLELPLAEQLAGSLDAYLTWIEEHADAYTKLFPSIGAVPEVRELVDRVRDETAQRIVSRHRHGRARAGAPCRRARLAVVHRRRGPRLARAPRHGPRPAARAPARHAPGCRDRLRRAARALAIGAEDAVAGVAQAGADVAVAVELAVQAAVRIGTSGWAVRSAFTPSGAATRHTNRDALRTGALEARDRRVALPPVASIGSTTKTLAAATPDGMFW